MFSVNKTSLSISFHYRLCIIIWKKKYPLNRFLQIFFAKKIFNKKKIFAVFLILPICLPPYPKSKIFHRFFMNSSRFSSIILCNISNPKLYTFKNQLIEFYKTLKFLWFSCSSKNIVVFEINCKILLFSKLQENKKFWT